MTRGFLPNTDAALLAWSLNFSTMITATPTAYGLTSAQATAYTTLHTAFATALAACDPGTRNKADVIAKNSARATLKASARLLANAISGVATVTDAQRMSLGLNVRATPSPIPAPVNPPDLDIVSVSGRTVKIRLHSATVAGKRGKPAGVSGATVFSYVGPTAPTDLAAWRFEGNTTKTVVDVMFDDSVAAGTLVWLTAYWKNFRDLSGPACSPVSVHLQYGIISGAA